VSGRRTTCRAEEVLQLPLKSRYRQVEAFGHPGCVEVAANPVLRALQATMIVSELPIIRATIRSEWCP
jgi:hypothetical protein